MENRCKDEDSSTLAFLGEIKEGMEQRHPDKTEAEITVMFREYMVDLLGNYLDALDGFRETFNSVEDLKVKKPATREARLLDETYDNRCDFTFRIMGLRDVYDQVKLLNLVSATSYPAMSPQLAAWERTISKANKERVIMDGLFGGGDRADYGFLWNFLQEDIPRMKEEFKPFADFWKMSGEEAAEAVKEGNAKEDGGAEGAGEDKMVVGDEGSK
ncbi:hypothetical protein DL98DRAFT_537598 [Cadophora sp. DSE1049]|nr:hypothetical protein DL98DRAFT_537598 [Cadophora sp. DSE1049]